MAQALVVSDRLIRQSLRPEEIKPTLFAVRPKLEIKAIQTFEPIEDDSEPRGGTRSNRHYLKHGTQRAPIGHL